MPLESFELSIEVWEQDFDPAWMCLDIAYCSYQAALAAADIQFDISRITCLLELSVPCFFESAATSDLAKMQAESNFRLAAQTCLNTYGPTCGHWTPPV